MRILNELITQGLREDIARMLSDMLEYKFQQEAMMKYLISIRNACNEIIPTVLKTK